MATENYMGNPNLKNINVNIEWTDDLFHQYEHCRKDTIFFARNYCKIIHPDRGIIPFHMWKFQAEMIRKFKKHRFNIAKMPRQVGKTTSTAAFILHCVLFKENYSVAILANRKDQATDILGRIKIMFENLPPWLQQGVKRWNEGDIELENGSKIMTDATSGASIRGKTLSLVYLDEFAFVPSNIQESFMSSVYPTITSGTKTKIIITSTPNGMNEFYNIWRKSERGDNTYQRTEINWWDVPGRDEAFKQEFINNTSERQWRIEMECEFLGSSNTLIDGPKLAVLEASVKRPMFTSGKVDIYEDVKPLHSYILVVDTSRGASIDYSAFIVFDVSDIPYRIVAKYRNNEIEPIVYPTIIYNVGRHYNNAYVLVEVNDIGGQVADILLHDMEYENMLSTKVKGRAGQKINTGEGDRFALGVRTTTQVKRIGCANFKSLIENDKLLSSDKELYEECTHFIEHNKKYEADEGWHDDLVMCCVLFSWLVHQEYFKELTDQSSKNAVLSENIKQIEDQLTPFGWVDNPYYKTDQEIDEEPYEYWEHDAVFKAWF